MRPAIAAVFLCMFALPAWAQSSPPNASGPAAPPAPDGMAGMDMSGMGPMPAGPGGNGSPPADSMAGMDMAGMDMSGEMTGMAMHGLFGAYPAGRDASGTAWQPDLAHHGGLETMAGDWMLMGHLNLLAVADSQSGPRGDDKVFAAGMMMGMAQRNFAGGDLLNFRLMLSPDPLMGRSGYPLLLAGGETANGLTPLVDRQHPHDLVMELAGSYSHPFTEKDSIFLYLGYPGEPALGPPAFMHRASGIDDPAAPITHHWMDSTHIAFGVATAGLVHDNWKVELSQFTGREPDPFRFNFDKPRWDSTAARVSYNPDEHWALQLSWGHLNSPEQLEPGIDETRTTASAIYMTKFSDQSSLAVTVGWGHKSLSNGVHLDGLLGEAAYKPDDAWTLFARGEWEENGELTATPSVRRVGALSLGLVHDWKLADHWKLGLGALYAFDFVPSSLTAAYGADPHGTMLFLRVLAD